MTKCYSTKERPNTKCYFKKAKAGTETRQEVKWQRRMLLFHINTGNFISNAFLLNTNSNTNALIIFKLSILL